MDVRILTGTFGSPDGFAINDFNLIPTGTISDQAYIFPDTDSNGGCSWGTAQWGSR